MIKYTEKQIRFIENDLQKIDGFVKDIKKFIRGYETPFSDLIKSKEEIKLIEDNHKLKEQIIYLEKIIKRDNQALQIAVKSAREEIYKWSEEWFDNKRKNNDMWRSNQDELTSMFLDEFEKRFLKEAKR